MPHFVNDETDLNFPKSDKTPLPPGQNPDKYVSADDWNEVCQAAVDLRDYAKTNKIVYVSELATGGTGTSGDPWTGWETSLADDVPANTEVYFSAGYFQQTAPIDITEKTGWTLRGAGKDSTYLRSAHNTSGILATWGTGLNFPTVGPPSVQIVIEDLTLANYSSGTTVNVNNVKGGLDLYGGTYISLNRVRVIGFYFGLVLDACELVNVTECDFSASLSACAILVNSDDWNVDSASDLTNAIWFKNCQFNAGSTVYCLVDDGGTCHRFSDCNFNGGTRHMRISGINNLLVENCEFETATNECVQQHNLSFIGSQAIGPGTNNTFISNSMSATGSNVCMSFVGTVTNLIGNSFYTNSAVAPLTGTDNLFRLYAQGNSVNWSGPPATAAGFASDLVLSSVADPTTGFANNQYFTGINTLQPRTALDIKGALSLRANSTLVDPLVNGANHNIVVDYYTLVSSTFEGTSFYRITGPTGAFSISGFDRPNNGRLLHVFNTTAQQMTITNQAGSSAANQITTLTGADVVLRAGTSAATFIYDSVTSKWILLSSN